MRKNDSTDFTTPPQAMVKSMSKAFYCPILLTLPVKMIKILTSWVDNAKATLTRGTDPTGSSISRLKPLDGEYDRLKQLALSNAIAQQQLDQAGDAICHRVLSSSKLASKPVVD
jgi:hypothetical protein